MKTTTIRLLTSLAVSVLAVGVGKDLAQSEMVQASDSEQVAEPVEFQKIVEFDREVHFQTIDGQDRVFAPGEYVVEAAENALRLKSADSDEVEAVIIRAESASHDRSVESPEPLSMSGNDDQHVVGLLLPEGKALQAVGSYSGIFSRHPHIHLQPGFLGNLAGKVPLVKSILVTPAPPPYDIPPPGNITPYGMVYIKGEQFGTLKGKVMLQVQVPVEKHFSVSKGTVTQPGTKAGTRKIQLEVQKWSPDKITAKMPLVSGVPDHSTVLQIFDAKGLGSPGRKVPFWAMRVRVTLQFGENVAHVSCSVGANYGVCLEKWADDPAHTFEGPCFFSGGPQRTDKTISAWHLNCHGAVDVDKGIDSYTIELKNNWVIEEIRWGWRPSSTSEKLRLPSAAALTKKYKGGSKMTLPVPWEVSPGPDWLSYWVDVDVKGPAGVLYGDRVYWKK